MRTCHIVLSSCILSEQHTALSRTGEDRIGFQERHSRCIDRTARCLSLRADINLFVYRARTPSSGWRGRVKTHTAFNILVSLVGVSLIEWRTVLVYLRLKIFPEHRSFSSNLGQLVTLLLPVSELGWWGIHSSQNRRRKWSFRGSRSVSSCFLPFLLLIPCPGFPVPCSLSSSYVTLLFLTLQWVELL